MNTTNKMIGADYKSVPRIYKFVGLGDSRLRGNDVFATVKTARNRFFTWALWVIFTLCLLSFASQKMQAQTYGWYGSGGPGPFVINDADDLAGLAEIVNGTWGLIPASDNFNGKTITLAADINLSGYTTGDGWTPIGKDTDPFSGTFDGGNHTITHLKIDGSGISFIGLFGYVDGGTIKNLQLDGVAVRAVSSSGTGGNNVGGVVGIVSGSVSNCHVTGTVEGITSVGGVAGWARAIVLADCTSEGAISGAYQIGGIAGRITDNSNMTDCTATDIIVTGTDNSIGGIAGSVDGSEIDGCHVTGASPGSCTVSGASNVGGVAGTVSHGSELTDCSSSAAVSGSGDYIGGVAGGVLSNSSVEDCVSTGNVSGTGGTASRIGGVAGTVDHSVISGCHSTGAISGGYINIGGIAGLVLAGAIKNCYSNGNVNGDDGVGGVVGQMKNTIGNVVDDCYSTG